MQRKSQQEIADTIGISQSRVSQIVSELQRDWLNSAMRDWDTLKSEELARINEVESEAWIAWRRSTAEYTEITEEVNETPTKQIGEDGKITIISMGLAKTRLKREMRYGDPRFLQIINQCIERRCNLLGLDAPKIVDIELRIREAARAEGLDEEAAVEEARRLLRSYADA